MFGHRRFGGPPFGAVVASARILVGTYPMIAGRSITHGSSDQSTVIRILSLYDSQPVTDVTSESAGLALRYRREGGSVVSIDPSDLEGEDSSHADGGMVSLGDGYYRVDLPDAACASGAAGLLVSGTVSGMVVVGTYHPLVAYDSQDAAGLGLSRIDENIGSRSDYDGSDTSGTTELLARLTEDRAGYLENLDVEGPVASSAEVQVVDSNVDTLVTRLSASRAGYLDNLNVGGLVASQSEVTSIQNNTRVVRVVPNFIERPESDSITFKVNLLIYDQVGDMEEPDEAPTVNVENQAGDSRNTNLDSTTMTEVDTGHYTAEYTLPSTHDKEQLIWTFSVVEGAKTRKYQNSTTVVDTIAVDFTSADRAKLNTLHDDRLTDERAAALDNLDATVSSRSSHSVSDVWSNGSRTLTAFTFQVTVGTNNDKTGYGLADGAITAAKIADGAITSAKAPNLDAAVSTRSSHSAEDVWGVEDRTLTEFDFEVTVGTVNAGVITEDAIADGAITEAKAPNLDAAVSTRSSHSAEDVWSEDERTLSSFQFEVTVGTNSDKTGYTLSSQGVDAILDAEIAEPTTVFSWGSATLRKLLQFLGALWKNKITQTSNAQTLRNDADNANIATASTGESGGTFTRGKWQ